MAAAASGVRRVDLGWLTSLLDEGPKAVAALSVALNILLIREIKVLYSRLLDRAEREREQQQKTNDVLGQDSRLISEFIAATKTMQRWQQAAGKEPRGDA